MFKDVKMSVKELYKKIMFWLRTRMAGDVEDEGVALDDEGLLMDEQDNKARPGGAAVTHGNQVQLRRLQAGEKSGSIEVLQIAFNRLVDQLQGINENLGRQVEQHKELTSRVDELPKLLGSLPEAVANQKRVTEELVGQLKGSAMKNQQFIETIEKIPHEAERQTNVLLTMTDQLSAAADSQASTTDSFNRFHESVVKLDSTIAAQRESIIQMNNTFAASDRYLKYLITKQGRQFMWAFWTAVTVCVIAIFSLVITVAVVVRR